MHFVEEKAIFIIGREGLYPKLGSLTTGSGFAYGVGFRDRDLLNNTGQLDLWAATSTRLYWATEARLDFPKLANNHLHFETWAAHRDYPEEDFFGLGPDSARDDQTSYAIRSDLFGAARRRSPVSAAPGGRRRRVPEPKTRRGPGHRACRRSRISSIPPRRPGLASRSTTSGRWRSSSWTIASRRTRGRAAGIR